MATILISISGGTPPYTITVTENSSSSPVICNSGCSPSSATSRAVDFTTITGTHNYKVRITDSSTPVCTQDQLTGNLTCTVAPGPIAFNLNVVNPTCSGGVLTQASITISGIVSGNRYAYAASAAITGNDCSLAIPISGSSVTLPVSAPAPGQGQVYTIRLWSGTDCSTYLDKQVIIFSPSCGGTTCTLGITLGTATC